MPETEPQVSVPQPRKKRPLGRLADKGLDADRPRPQTARTAALLARRRSLPTRPSPPESAGGEARPDLCLQTADSRVTFMLRGSADSLLLQRTSCRRADAQLSQSFHFTTAGAFDLWCKANSLRFEEPHLWAQLLHAGHEFLCGAR